MTNVLSDEELKLWRIKLLQSAWKRLKKVSSKNRHWRYREYLTTYHSAIDKRI